MPDLHDSRRLIGALIRSIPKGNAEKIHELGEQLVADWDGAHGADQDGIMRPFDELEDTDFLVDLIDLSPQRKAKLKNASGFTKEEVASLVDAVKDRCFEDDGTNDAWSVTKIGSGDGTQAYIAQVLKDGGLGARPLRTFVGVFSSLTEAKEALRRFGYIDGADFRRRYPLRNS